MAGERRAREGEDAGVRPERRLRHSRRGGARTTTPATERAQRLSALRAGELRCLFSVDLFNEGVDLPDVDTVIFLRPTESATLFLQQLGRGLRRSERKECLTVLDFIGGAHRKFRFDLRYRAIVGGTRRSVQREIEDGFPSLPSGCVIQLDAVASRTVLDNIRSQLGTGMTGLVDDLRGLVRTKGPDVDLATFLAEAGLEPEDLYTNDRTWTGLRRAAGLPVVGGEDPQIERALARMLHIDDPLRLEGLRRFVQQAEVPRADDRDPLQRLLFVLLGYVRRPYAELQSAWDALWSGPMRDELVQLLGVLDDRARRVTHPLSGALARLPLQVHGTYSLDEILASVDERTENGGVKRIQTGVFRSLPTRSDLLFVTLEKNEKEYSPTTLYKDYAISPTLFHWETQSNCHEGTETGQRSLRAARARDEHALLFVRARKRDARGETMPYAFLGEVFHYAHRGARPMQIEWELAVPMPAGFYQETKVARDEPEVRARDAQNIYKACFKLANVRVLKLNEKPHSHRELRRAAARPLTPTTGPCHNFGEGDQRGSHDETSALVHAWLRRHSLHGSLHRLARVFVGFAGHRPRRRRDHAGRRCRNGRCRNGRACR